MEPDEWNVGGGSGVRSTESLVKIGKWSDGEQWVTDRDAELWPKNDFKYSGRPPS